MTKINLTDPRVIEIVGLQGFDCIWLDMEHVPCDWVQVENLIRSAKLYDMDTLVRVSKGSYSDLIKPFEADATGIMVPHVMSFKEAKKIVRNTRFHPIGRRAIDGGNCEGKYGMLDIKSYIKHSNVNQFVCIQIEDPEPLDELDEIIGLDGIDMVFFGPNDFSHALGIPGELDDERVISARRRVAEAAKKHGKIAATSASLDTFRDLIEEGYCLINISADVVALSEYYKGILDTISKF
jgi:4-hydroxy-2-oxoheptanedioate aldolase